MKFPKTKVWQVVHLKKLSVGAALVVFEDKEGRIIEKTISMYEARQLRVCSYIVVPEK